MNYRPLGPTNLNVSEIGFGSWAIGGTGEAAGMQWGWGETPEADAIAAVQRARDLGVNFFDTADVYGNGRSEEILGKALGSDWNKVYVASKAGNVVRHGKGAKVSIVKFKRRAHYLRQKNHRQLFTEVKVTDISAG